MYQAESEAARTPKEVCIDSYVAEIEELVSQAKGLVRDYVDEREISKDPPQAITFLDCLINRLENIKDSVALTVVAIATIKKKLGNL